MDQNEEVPDPDVEVPDPNEEVPNSQQDEAPNIHLIIPPNNPNEEAATILLEEALNGLAAPAAENRYKELLRLVGVEQSRLRNLQTVAFIVIGFYFTFQVSIFGAVCSSSTLQCVDGWYVSSVSFLGGTLLLCVLGFIAMKYSTIMEARNFIRRQFPEREALLYDLLGFDPVWRKRDRMPSNTWRLLITFIVLIFLILSLVISSGMWLVICRRERKK